MTAEHKLAIGTVQFGLSYGISNPAGQTPPEEVKAILNTARSFGINTLDTAFDYGSSEEVIGLVADAEWDIVSKFPPKAAQTGISHFLEESLAKLSRSSIKGYLAHDADDLLIHTGLWEELIAIKECGKVNKIGFSVYTPEQLDRLLSKNMVPDIIQIPYNFLDRRFGKYISYLKSNDIEIHSRSAFLQGVFFMDVLCLETFFDPVKNIILELKNCYKTNDDLARALLDFCLETEIDKVVIGINNHMQLVNNLAIRKGDIRSIKDFNFLVENTHIKEEILLPFKWPKKRLC